MGLGTIFLRGVYLMYSKNDLESKIQTITQAKLGIASSLSDLLNAGTDLDPDSPEIKLLDQRRQKLELMEKRLDVALGGYKAKLQAVETELESVLKLAEKNINMIFKYGGGR